MTYNNDFGRLNNRLNHLLENKQYKEILNILNSVVLSQYSTEQQVELHNIGMKAAYFSQDLENAMNHVTREIELQEQIEDLEGLAEAYQSKGTLLQVKKDHTQALEWFMKANDLKITNPDIKDKIIYSIANILMHTFAEYEDAFNYYKTGFELAETNNQRKIWFYLDHMGMAKYHLNEFDEALKLYNMAEDKIDTSQEINQLYHTVSKCKTLLILNKYDQVIDNLNEVKNLQKQNNDTYSRTEYNLLLVDLSLEIEENPLLMDILSFLEYPHNPKDLLYYILNDVENDNYKPAVIWTHLKLIEYFAKNKNTEKIKHHLAKSATLVDTSGRLREKKLLSDLVNRLELDDYVESPTS